MNRTDTPGFMKDDTPGQARAVLNIDNASYTAFKLARDKERDLQQVKSEVQSMKQDINDIKMLLTQLINGKQ